MKPLLLLTILLTLLCTSVRAQCPAGNVVLETNAEVVAFVAQWPNCDNLPGSLNIQSNVSDVSSLGSLKNIDGTLTIRNTPLTDLKGLHNITAVTGGVGISDIDALNDLASLPLSLASVGGQLSIINNANLSGIEALQNLTSADELTVTDNAALKNLNGLDAVTIASGLTITNNPDLAICNAAGICAALSLPAADITISGNDVGCANYFQVEAACTGNDCPQNITVTTNQEIIDITTAYPNCVDLPGDLTVTDDANQIFRFSLKTVAGNVVFENLNYSNFDQLALTDIGGNFEIISLPNLISTFANGPLPLQTVGGTVRFQNIQTVTNIAAFQNVTSIGGLWLQGCDELYSEADFNSWQGVALTGGMLILNNNPNIQDLEFLDLFNFTGVAFDRLQIAGLPLIEDISSLEVAGSFDEILLANNPNLDACSIAPICTAIVTPGASLNFQNNGTGCSTIAEVKIGCFPDLYALIDIYNATDGPNWTDNTGWVDGAAGSNCTPCDGTWLGITCDGNDRVTGISMVSNNLVGSIPSSIGQLSMLEVIGLANNSLTGAIPDEIFSLPLLERLFFTINNFTGGIPASIGNAPALEQVVFTANPNLGGAIPSSITNVTTLTSFSAEGSGLTGALPIINDGDLPNLRWLLLGQNNLSGNFSGNYGFLTSLERIELSDNNFSGLIPSIFAFVPNLKTLHLENNGFINGLPSELNAAINLEELKISNNNLTGPLRANLRDLVKLEIFEVDENGFTGSVPALDQSPDLLIYNVADNGLDGMVPDALLNCAIIEVIDMSDNGFTGPLPLFPADNAGTLTSLRVANNNFAGCYPTEYAALCAGTTTDFSGNAGLPGGGSASSFTVDFCQNNDACSSLPVSWLGFSARLEGKVARLNWQTAVEENNAGFTVQRSHDGVAWTILGQVSVDRNDYSFIDESPLSGIGYYRIKQTDIDGNFTFSQVASLRLEADDILAFPNPFRGQLTVFSSVEDVVEIYNINGQKVVEYTHWGGGAQVQKLDLKGGVYTLRLRSSGRVTRVIAR
jgi:hypothetical protein